MKKLIVALMIACMPVVAWAEGGRQVGKWIVDSREDPMTDAKTFTSYTPEANGMPARFYAICLSGSLDYGFMVILGEQKLDSAITSRVNAEGLVSIPVRFDKEPRTTYDFYLSETLESLAIKFPQTVRKFMSDSRNRTLITFDLRDYVSGNGIFVFDISHMHEVVKPVFEACGMPQP